MEQLPLGASSTPRVTTQHGVDMLWQHQLRKEDAALLDKINTSRKMIEDIESETTVKLLEAGKRISSLEMKLSTIGDEGTRMREAKQKWDDDIIALKTKMGIITESLIPESMSFLFFLAAEY